MRVAAGYLEGLASMAGAAPAPATPPATPTQCQHNTHLHGVLHAQHVVAGAHKVLRLQAAVLGALLGKTRQEGEERGE